MTSGTVSNTDTVPTVTDNLYSSGTISTELIGIYYVPAAESDATGTLDFGATDDSQHTGDITYTPITSTSPASGYWGIDQSISYGGSTILDSTAGIVDTGTTLLLLATDAFSKYEKATGGTLDSTTGLLKITSSQYSALSDLDFSIGGATFTLNANAQIWPRSLNSQIGGESGSIYLIASDIGTNSGSGLDFINGYAFLYVCFPLNSLLLLIGISASASTPFSIPLTPKLDSPPLNIPLRPQTRWASISSILGISLLHYYCCMFWHTVVNLLDFPLLHTNAEACKD